MIFMPPEWFFAFKKLAARFKCSSNDGDGKGLGRDADEFTRLGERDDQFPISRDEPFPIIRNQHRPYIGVRSAAGIWSEANDITRNPLSEPRKVFFRRQIRGGNR